MHTDGLSICHTRLLLQLLHSFLHLEFSDGLDGLRVPRFVSGVARDAASPDFFASALRLAAFFAPDVPPDAPDAPGAARFEAV